MRVKGRRRFKAGGGFLGALVLLCVATLGDGLEITANVSMTEDTKHDYHISIKAGESVQLQCEDERGTHSWQLPKNHDLIGYDEFDAAKRIVEESFDGWTKTLTIAMAKPSDSGFYRCGSLDDSEPDEVYVFVQSGEDNVFLRTANDGFSVSSDNNFTIPCRTSRPLKDDEHVILVVEGKHWKSADKIYDPRRGFAITSKSLEQKITQRLSFSCQLESSNDTNVMYFITPQKEGGKDLSSDISFQWIEGTEEMDWPYVGGNIDLVCRLEQLPEIIDKYKMFLNVSCPRCEDASVVTIKKTSSSEINRTITIAELKAEDSGSYKCHWFKDGELKQSISKEIVVSPRKEQIRELSRSPGTVRDRMPRDGDTLELIADLAVFPSDTSRYRSQWMRSFRHLFSEEDSTEVIVSDVNYHMNQSVAQAGGRRTERLVITNIRTDMAGKYILKITNGDAVHTVEWNIKIDSTKIKPRIVISNDSQASVFLNQSFYKTGSTVKVSCVVEHFPLIRPIFKKKTGGSDWNTIGDAEYIHGTYESALTTEYHALDHGEFYCEGAFANKAKKSTSMELQVADDAPSIHVSKQKPPTAPVNEDANMIFEGDDVTLECSVPAYKQWDVEWRFKDMALPETTSEHVSHNRYVKTTIRNVSAANSGEYTCLVRGRGGSQQALSQFINIQRTIKPSKQQPNPNSDFVVTYAEEASLECLMTGEPKPFIQWFKNGKEISNDGGGVQFDDNNSKIKFAKVTGEDSGTYECVGSNRAGRASRKIELTVEGAPRNISTRLVTIVGIVIMILIAALLLMLRMYAKQRKKSSEQQRTMELMYEQLMRGGDINDPGNGEAIQLPSIHSKMNLEARAQATAYDARYEIDEKCLSLDMKQIGCGHFGVVLKGSLFQRPPNEPDRGKPLLVAVKRPMRNRPEALMSLMQELKILIALDAYRAGALPHPNVLALVGASTNKIKEKGDMLVAFELCELGDLKTFLMRNRSTFVDELEEVGDEDEDASADEYLLPDKKQASNAIKYKSETDTTGQSKLESDRLLPESKTLATSDLISFAMQIASGMEYIASIPCIHRDLAARNVLLTSNRVAKIADFGLTKMEQKDYYRMQTETKVPVKWLALEALETHIFSVESDVWAFGVVLYELFSLGSDPYPGLQQNVHSFLKSGKRMDRPTYCHPDIYHLMLRTWDVKPENRPSFAHCQTFLRDHLRLASSALLRHVDAELQRCVNQINNFDLYRGERTERLDDRAVAEALNGRARSRPDDVESGDRIYIQEFSR